MDDVANLHAAGQAAWPGLSLSFPVFAAYIEGGTARAPAADLYLACACLHGLRGAVRRFDARHAAPVRALLARRVGSAIADEVQQRLWVQLFVGTRDCAPKIANYRGRGPLAGWLRIAALRMAVHLRRDDWLARADGTERLCGLALPARAEAEELPARHLAAVRGAFLSALDGLPERDRALLALSSREVLSVDVLGTRLGVHRATAARWLARARETLRERTLGAVAERLHMAPDDAESLVCALEGELATSLSRFAREAC